MAAGIATLERLRDGEVYERLETLGARLEDGLAGALERHAGSLSFTRIGSMFTLFFSGERVTDFDAAMRCDTGRFGSYHRGMLERGVYLPPSQFEANFISVAHTDADIDRTVAAMNEAVDAVMRND